MRLLHDPGTALLALSAGASVAGQVNQAQQQAAAQEAQAAQAEAQASREEVQRERQLEDLNRAEIRRSARARAALSATGGSGTNQRQQLLQDIGSRFGRRRARVGEDSRFRQETLLSRSGNLQDQASAARIGGFVSAGAEAGSSLFQGFQRANAGGEADVPGSGSGSDTSSQ